MIDEQIRGAAREIVDDLTGAGDIDFVEQCASKPPMRTINDMMGVPESERVAAARAHSATVEVSRSTSTARTSSKATRRSSAA